jgi:hypothetical protein
MNQNSPRYKLKLSPRELARIKNSITSCQNVWLNRCRLTSSIIAGKPGHLHPGFYMNSVFFNSGDNPPTSTRVYKVPTLEGYVSMNSIRYLSTFLPKVAEHYHTLYRQTSQLLNTIESASTPPHNFTIAVISLEMIKENVRSTLSSMFVRDRKFLNDFSIYCKSEQYIAPKGADIFSYHNFKYLPHIQGDTFEAPHLSFIPSTGGQTWCARGFSQLFGNFGSDNDSLDFISCQIKEEDLFRIMVKLALGLPVDISNSLVLVVSKNVFKELLQHESSGPSMLKQILKVKGVSLDRQGLGCIHGDVFFMGNYIGEPLVASRPNPLMYYKASTEYGNVGFPIIVLDEKARLVNLPTIEEHPLMQEINLPASVFKIKEVLTDKIFEAIDYSIKEEYKKRSGGLTEEAIAEIKQASEFKLKETFAFKGKIIEEVVETPAEEPEIGEFISPEELAEISAFVNESDEQEPLPELPEEGTDEQIPISSIDLAVEAINRRRQQRIEEELGILPVTPQESFVLGGAAPLVPPLGQTIITGTAGAEQLYRSVGDPPSSPYVWNLESPRAQYTMAADPAVEPVTEVEFEQTDSLSEAETQGETNQ